jgi:hypothetical protein
MLRTILLSASLAVLVACSGASSSDLFDPVGSETSGTETAPGSTTTPVGNGSTPPPPPDPGMPPAPPKPECKAEVETNDEIKHANPFDACFTGKVSGADTDYAAITAPTTATKVAIEHESAGGKVAYRIFINGVGATSAFTGDPPDITVIPGATYQFQMRTSPSNATTERTYVLRVRFE